MLLMKWADIEKSIFRRIICFGSWRINMESIEFIRFLLGRFVQDKFATFVKNCSFVTFKFFKWRNLPGEKFSQGGIQLLRYQKMTKI